MKSAINNQTISGLLDLEEPGESGFLNEIVTAFLTDTRMRLDSMRAAHSRGDALGMTKLAHSLKGSSINLGADKLSSLAQGIEKEAKAGRVGELIAIEEAELEFVRAAEELKGFLTGA